MRNKIRHILWRILGFDYQEMLNKTDFTLLRNDHFSTMGTGSYDNGAKVWRWSNAELKIGNYCSIANNVNFLIDEGHHTSSSITNFPLHKRIENKIEFNRLNFPQKEGITVGNDVWIGMGAYIMPGVTIGNGAIIATNSVVTKDVTDYAVVGGIPASIIRMKHNENIIKQLNQIAWWNWSEKKITDCCLDFFSPLEQFIEKYGT